MIPIRLGIDDETEEEVFIDRDSLATHLHLIGRTGAGKTTAIQTILRALMIEPREQNCLFILDAMGGLSCDLLRLIADPRYSTDAVRDRLVYVEPAQEDVVLPFNPLAFTTEATRYYQTMRAVDIVLRAWAAQDASQQPRLLQWMYKSFCAAAALGFPISMCRFLLHPGTDEHKAILRRMPPELAAQWGEILNARGSEAVRILESTRNRMDPFFESEILRRMFGMNRSNFDVERMIRERKIVILNLAEYGRIPGFIADTIGGLALNEIIETAIRMATTEGREAVDPVYILMDEFQRFVSRDVENALPTVRQCGIRLLLAHQSFSQLERPDVDLTQMIWQAQSRGCFSNSARDADILADEFAKRTFDPLAVKYVDTEIRQIIVDYRKVWLRSVSETNTHSSADMAQTAHGYNVGSGVIDPPGPRLDTHSRSSSRQSSESSGHTFAQSTGETHSRGESVVPVHKTYEKESKTFLSVEESTVLWGQKIRQLKTGRMLWMAANDPAIREVRVHRIPISDTPALRDAVEELLADNFESDFFVSAAEADREAEECRRTLLQPPPIAIDHKVAGNNAADVIDVGESSSTLPPTPFRN